MKVSQQSNLNAYSHNQPARSPSHASSPRAFSQRKIQLPDSTEIDSLSLVLVDDLLSGINDWRSIPEIVRATFKALTEVVKNQSEAIKDLERQNISNVKLVSLQEYLDTKVNTSDVKESLNEIVSILETKPSFDDLQTRLQSFSLKDEVEYHLQNKLSILDAKTLFEQKVSASRWEEEVETIFARMEETVEDIKRLRNKVEQDLANLENDILIRPTNDDVNAQLETKANKQSVTNALQRKANKVDLENALLRKAETTDIQNLITMINEKVDYNALDSVANIVEGKVDKTELTHIFNTLASKAERNDIEILQSQLQQSSNELESFKALYEKDLANSKTQVEDVRFLATSGLNKKAEQKDLEKLYAITMTKVDNETFSSSTAHLREEMVRDVQDLKEQVSQQRKISEEAQAQRLKKIDSTIESVRESITQANESLKNESEQRRHANDEQTKFTKNLLATYKKESQKELQYILDDLQSVKESLQQALPTKLDRAEFVDFRVKVLATLDDKTDLQEVQNALNACQSDASARYLELKDELKALISENETSLVQLIETKANTNDVQSALASKTDTAGLMNLLAAKASTHEIEEIRKHTERAVRECEDKANAKDFEAFVQQTNSTVDELHRDMILKSNIKDVCVLLDAKSSIEDVNRALGDIHRELEKKSYQEDLNNIVSDQAVINEQLCTENIVARWTWKSGEIKAGSLVPWEVQLVNTLPDNFLWEKEKTSILIVAPGLYEVTLGFYAKKKPTIQLLVNGEPIMSAVNTSSYVMHHTSGKIKDIKHSSGVITGLTLVDFVLIPARARISLTYTGEFGGEGFFGLKRL